MEVKADDEAARRGVEDWSKDDASGWGRHRGAEGAASQCFRLPVCVDAPRLRARGGGAVVDTVVAAAVTCDMSLDV